jgi:hypothetical protein
MKENEDFLGVRTYLTVVLIVFLAMLIIEFFWGSTLALTDDPVPTTGNFVYFIIWSIIKCLITCLPLIFFRFRTLTTIFSIIILISDLFWLYILVRGMDVFGFDILRPLSVSILVATLSNLIITGTCLWVIINKIRRKIWG